jgi:hypothetical protein
MRETLWKLSIALVCVLTLATTSTLPSKAGRSTAPTFEEKLDTRIERFETGGRPLATCLIDLAYQHELPIGIEFLDRQALTHPIDLRFQNETVRGIIVAMVHQIPDYRVTFSEGLVDIFKLSERQNPSNLLNRVIKDFSVAEEDTTLANLEITCALARNVNPTAACISSVAKGQLGDQKITLHMQNARIYEIVNRIVARNGKAAWAVTVPPSKLIGFESSDLWHIYPLKPPFKDLMLDKLLSIKL